MKDDNDEIYLILDILESNPDGIIIKDIAAELNLNRDTIARHLRVLLMRGDVEIKQIGPAKIYYRSRRIPESVLKNFCPYPQVYFNRLMRVYKINEEFRQLTGPIPEVIVGKRPDELDIPLLSDELLDTNYRSALKGRKIVKYLNTSLNGKDYYFKAVMLPVVLEDGRAGLCLVLVDKSVSDSEDILYENSESFYRTIVEDQTEYICRVLPDGTFTYANHAYCEMRGKKPDELIGRKFLPLNLTKIISDKNPVISIDNPVITEEIQIVLPNGEISWQQWKIRGIFDENGVLAEYQMAGRDFTDLKRAEDQIKMYHSNLEILIKERTNELQVINRELLDEISERKETEERLNLAIEGSKYAFWDWDLVTGRFVFSKRLNEMLGLNPEEINISIDLCRSRIHPDDLDYVIRSQNDHFSGVSDFYEAEYRMKHSGGYYIWVYAIGRVSSRNTDGTPIRISGLLADISEKVQMKKDFEFQKLLINSLAQVSGLKEAINICLRDTLECYDLNSGCFYIFDNESDKLSLFSSSGFLPADTECLNDFKLYLEENIDLRSGESEYLKLLDPVLKGVCGPLINGYKSVAVVPINHNNVFVGVFCFFSGNYGEIPDRLRNTLESTSDLLNGTLLRIKSEGEMQKTQKHLALALKSTKIAIFEINLQNEMMTFYYSGDNSVNEYGNSLKIVQIPWKKFIHPEDYGTVLLAIEKHMNGSLPYYRSSYRVISKNGKVKWYFNSGEIAERDDDNNPLIISGISVNITREKEKYSFQK